MTADTAVATLTGQLSSSCSVDIEAGLIDCVVVYKVDRLQQVAPGLCQDDGGLR